MKNLMRSNKIIIIAVIWAFLGFLDATYLTIKHYTDGFAACTISGCEQVLTSNYAAIGPVPVSGIGIIYYLSLLVLAIIYLDRQWAKALQLLLITSGIGLLATAYLVWLQLFVIHAICLYCAFSALSTLIIFVLSFIKLKTPMVEGAELEKK